MVKLPRKNAVGVGDTFGRLTVIGPRFTEKGKSRFPCRCACGVERSVLAPNLRSGNTTSCGCAALEWRRQPRKHGGCLDPSQKRLYWVWSGMIQRCTNPNHTSYRKYGARGIQVCSEWATDYKAFREWALPAGYRAGLTIDRIDNNGPYTPGNCRWVDASQQSSNTRQNVVLAAFGEEKPLGAWSRDRRCVVKYGTLAWRIRSGWDGEAALTTPHKLIGPAHRQQPPAAT